MKISSIPTSSLMICSTKRCRTLSWRRPRRPPRRRQPPPAPPRPHHPGTHFGAPGRHPRRMYKCSSRHSVQVETVGAWVSSPEGFFFSFFLSSFDFFLLFFLFGIFCLFVIFPIVLFFLFFPFFLFHFFMFVFLCFFFFSKKISYSVFICPCAQNLSFWLATIASRFLSFLC